MDDDNDRFYLKLLERQDAAKHSYEDTDDRRERPASFINLLSSSPSSSFVLIPPSAFRVITLFEIVVHTIFTHTHTRFRCGLFLFIFRYHDDQKPPDCVQSSPDHGLGHGLSVFSAFDYPVCSASCPRKCRRMSKSPRLQVVATGRRGSPCLERTRGLTLFLVAISQNGQNDELGAMSSSLMTTERIIAS